VTDTKAKLPPEVEDKVIDVSLKHVTLAFTLAAIGIFVVGAGIVVVKDYSRFRRQTAIIDTINTLIQTIQEGGIPKCKEKKVDTSSPMKS